MLQRKRKTIKNTKTTVLPGMLSVMRSFSLCKEDTMRKLLEEFWYGSIFPQEQYVAQQPNIKPLIRLVEKNRTNLAETLTEAQKEVLEKYDDVVSEMNGILEREIFIYAFRLGGRFMVETLSKDE